MARRIGVYICHCGGNISDVVDVKKVVEAVKDEPDVVVAKDFMFMCSDAGQKMIQDDIKNLNLDGVVVASCSPKLHETTFRNCVRRAGLNPYLYYHANIREDCSWAHSDSPELATLKAINHVRAAIAYVRYAKPLDKIKVNTMPAVLVIGGGIAGMKAALVLSDMGVSVYLVEKEPFIGGRVAQLGDIYPYNKTGVDIVKNLIDEIRKRDNIAIYTNAEVEELNGYIGNFKVKIRVKPRYFKGKCKNIIDLISKLPADIPDEFNYGVTKRTPIILPPYSGAYPEIPQLDIENCNSKCRDILKECDAVDFNMKEETITLNVGAIVVATGFDPYEPKIGEFGYKIYRNVVTLPQFIRIININRLDKLVYGGKEIKDIVFIYCVGSRQTKVSDGKVSEYCSRYCCNAAVNASLSLLKKFPEVRLYHIFRDMRTYGRSEIYYEELGKKGAIFLRFREDNPPKVSEKDGKLVVSVYDNMINEMVDIKADLIVLVVGMVPRRNDTLNKILKLPLGKDGFYQEVHPKLRPVETSINGIFLAGTCQGPKDIIETISSASAAAGKAATIVLRGYIELEPFVAYVDVDKCDMCGICVDECKYGAIEIRDYGDKGKKAWVNKALCKGCGLCVSVCPKEAIQLSGLETRQLKEMIKCMARW